MADYVFDTGYGTLDTGTGIVSYPGGATLLPDHYYRAGIVPDRRERGTDPARKPDDMEVKTIRELPLAALAGTRNVALAKAASGINRDPDHFYIYVENNGEVSYVLAWDSP